MSREEKLELTLFMTVRNSIVLPIGIKLDKTQKEITDMTKETMIEIQSMIDYKKAKEFYEL
jgi:hypothetical protein